ncbi:MAG: lipopolysaccharide biosynthesis protein [Sphingobacterium sp.]|nr:lipopolysaccharide biosynthesis protein [Sphingobacterium sp.]
MENKTLQTREELSLKQLILKVKGWFTYLLLKWYILVMAIILGAVASFFYAKSRKPIYKASTTFVLEAGGNNNNGGGMSQMAGLAALAGIDLGNTGGGIFQGDNLFELYKSRKMIEAVLLERSSSDSTKLLVDRYLEMEKIRDKWKEKKKELLQIDFAKKVPDHLQRQRDSILQTIVKDINKNKLTVGKNDKKSAIIKVDVKSTDEIFSKEFNESLVAQVNDFYIKTKTKKSLDNIEILQRKTDSVRAVMNGSISSAAVAIDATPNLNPTRQAQRLVPTQRSQFSAETNKAILGQLIQNLEMAKMNLMKEAPLIQKVDEPVLPLEVDKIGKIRATLIGGILAGLLAAVFLLFRKIFKNIMAK